MKHRFSTLTILLLLAAQAQADGLVEGSAEAGEARAITCGACHGADGNSVTPVWPSIAGQHATYIVNQLQAFKKGSRNNVLMTAQAMGLSDDDMANLAVYYSEKAAAPRAVSDAGLIEKGAAIYRGGSKEDGVPACMACHGPTGKGNPAASYPKLSGQYANYTVATLAAYASGERKSDGPTKVMREIASAMNAEQIESVAAYIQGLQ